MGILITCCVILIWGWLIFAGLKELHRLSQLDKIKWETCIDPSVKKNK